MSPQDEREAVFRAVRQALEPVARPAPLPDYDPADAVCRVHPDFDSDWDLFVHKLEAVNGEALVGWEALAADIRLAGYACGYCDPALAERLGPLLPDVELAPVFDRSDFDRYAFGVTRATAAVAETGTLVLNDRETASRLGALAPWAHYAVLDDERLLPDLPTALERLGDDPSVIFVTGPSKTADIEGILIEGVHGPGRQICCRVPKG